VLDHLALGQHLGERAAGRLHGQLEEAARRVVDELDAQLRAEHEHALARGLQDPEQVVSLGLDPGAGPLQALARALHGRQGVLAGLRALEPPRLRRELPVAAPPVERDAQEQDEEEGQHRGGGALHTESREEPCGDGPADRGQQEPAERRAQGSSMR
jgi:hypothetical protein